ncbi:MAG: aspartate aminotransferase family protein [Actinomycetota bacterium]|nr:aspartate aminotransferase family protein [Thermoleophilia bacterium]MDA3005274.1 aspartate aminotransferase family protein [Actinomycetota bacterium]
MPFDIRRLVADRLGENYELHEQYVNPTLVDVFRTIGFDRVYARGEGAYLWDDQGDQYLDMLGGFGVAAIGRNNPVVGAALRDVLDMDLPNMVQMDCALLSGLLAEALVQRTPPHLDAVYFCNSGTESVEASLKFARAATGRDRFVHFRGGWHGLTMGSLSVMGGDEFREGFGHLLPGDEVEPGDLEHVERLLAREDVAAVIVECVPGHSVKLPPDGFLARVQQLCRDHGTLLICDEVATGYGRTGTMFAFEHFGLEPDIIATSKALSGGYVPVAATICRRQVYQAVFSSMERAWVHSSSFGRNNLAMAAGLATLSVIDDAHMLRRSAEQGAKLRDGINSLAGHHEVLKEARGVGCLVAIELQRPTGTTRRLAWDAVHAMHQGLYPQMVVMPLLDRHRIITQVTGRADPIIRLMPPFVISDDDIRWFVDALDDVLARSHRVAAPLAGMGRSALKVTLSGRRRQRA